ncbi:ferredoxin reductase family protein [Winogradskyella undariae]|uniref:ferredoxin reductase family protein n=1 Tax=Winogradskyella undariae TaxID=1285465 RepID=UPI0015CCFDBE|nr:ferric reductase-like transmembrane domain-containing protein [Winogradskyella undariae]
MLKNIKISLVSVLLVLTGLWIVANMPFSNMLSVWSVRDLCVQYSGVIGIGVMSVAMVLTLRPVWLEPLLGGLDKSYRLHKWLGIVGLVAVIIHWIASKGPHWLSNLGVIEGRHHRASHSVANSLSVIQGFFQGLHSPAKWIGEWAFYGLVLLITLALIKRFSYKIFKKTHLLIAVIYLVLVFHAVILFNFSLWTQPLGMVMALLLISGSVSAVLVLTGQVGKRRKVEGIIETQHYFPKMKVLETEIRIKEGWRGHKSGQFAFVSFDKKEGEHPFTIASSWNVNNPLIMFITKGLGDYTNFLPERLSIEDKVIVEGPYGCFTFDDTAQRQIWIGGGIGITPFIARMKQLAKHPNTQAIDLFHSTTEMEPEVLKKLTADATAAHVKLHVIIDKRDGRLTGEKLRTIVPDWKSASIWFCGPKGFGAELRKDLLKKGLLSKNFHQELFSMR